MRIPLPVAVALLCASFGAQAQAPEIARGRVLYEMYCGECHYERVHQRKKPAVKDLAGLRDMAARWAPMTRHRFTLDEREEVVQYLNRSHYRFRE